MDWQQIFDELLKVTLEGYRENLVEKVFDSPIKPLFEKLQTLEKKEDSGP